MLLPSFSLILSFPRSEIEVLACSIESLSSRIDEVLARFNFKFSTERRSRNCFDYPALRLPKLAQISYITDLWVQSTPNTIAKALFETCPKVAPTLLAV